MPKEVKCTDKAYISAFNVLQNMSRDDIEIYHYCDAASFGVPPHRHDFYELYCLLSPLESYVYHIENNAYKLRPGSLILVPPGETHWPTRSLLLPCPFSCPRRWAPSGRIWRRST